MIEGLRFFMMDTFYSAYAWVRSPKVGTARWVLMGELEAAMTWEAERRAWAGYFDAIEYDRRNNGVAK